MLELLLAAMASPAGRAIIDDAVMTIWADITHRSNTDPDFLKKSDAVAAQWATAKTGTEDQKNAALSALRQLRDPA